LRRHDVGDINQLVLPGVQRVASPGLFWIISGTTPLVIAETIFWRCGANGMMLRSILLPLAFSKSAMTFLIATSSSGTKPWVHHTSAVLACALAI